jgi:DNA invertase Pin-like site-specific DNA recombinase
MRIAKARGRLCGKQPKLNPRQEAHLVALHRAGDHTGSELADLFSVARSTVYRAIQRDQHRQQTPTETPSESPHGAPIADRLLRYGNLDKAPAEQP